MRQACNRRCAYSAQRDMPRVAARQTYAGSSHTTGHRCVYLHFASEVLSAIARGIRDPHKAMRMSAPSHPCCAASLLGTLRQHSTQARCKGCCRCSDRPRSSFCHRESKSPFGKHITIEASHNGSPCNSYCVGTTTRKSGLRTAAQSEVHLVRDECR